MDQRHVDDLVKALSSDPVKTRLEALKELYVLVQSGQLPPPAAARDVNNHIHTTFSFSPYTPSRALWEAYNAGLCTAGIMDHDTVAGAPEFLEAGCVLNFPVTVGMELRASLAGTPFEDRFVNSPDQPGIAYIALHGIPHNKFFMLTNWMHPRREARMTRTRVMTDKLSGLLAPHGITLDFSRDVWPLSCADEGGSLTERHILYAAAQSITDKCGRGGDALSFVADTLGVPVPDKLRGPLSDADNPYYLYDLLGILKSGLLPQIFVPASAEECPPLADVVALCRRHDIIAAYPYLGDVGHSVTGDKAAQVFEDSFLEELFDHLVSQGIPAVSYMPSRNTPAQLARVRALCERHDLLQVSGEDINQPRQSFVCTAMRDPAFSNLYDNTWALIGHEWHATAHPGMGLCSPKTVEYMPRLSDRIELLKQYAFSLYHKEDIAV